VLEQVFNYFLIVNHLANCYKTLMLNDGCFLTILAGLQQIRDCYVVNVFHLS
jgi:hypothetical protein